MDRKTFEAFSILDRLNSADQEGRQAARPETKKLLVPEESGRAVLSADTFSANTRKVFDALRRGEVKEVSVFNPSDPDFEALVTYSESAGDAPVSYTPADVRRRGVSQVLSLRGEAAISFTSGYLYIKSLGKVSPVLAAAVDSVPIDSTASAPSKASFFAQKGIVPADHNIKGMAPLSAAFLSSVLHQLPEGVNFVKIVPKQGGVVPESLVWAADSPIPVENYAATYEDALQSGGPCLLLTKGLGGWNIHMGGIVTPPDFKPDMSSASLSEEELIHRFSSIANIGRQTQSHVDEHRFSKRAQQIPVGVPLLLRSTQTRAVVAKLWNPHTEIECESEVLSDVRRLFLTLVAVDSPQAITGPTAIRFTDRGGTEARCVGILTPPDFEF